MAAKREVLFAKKKKKEKKKKVSETEFPNISSRITYACLLLQRKIVLMKSECYKEIDGKEELKKEINKIGFVIKKN